MKHLTPLKQFIYLANFMFLVKRCIYSIEFQWSPMRSDFREL